MLKNLWLLLIMIAVCAIAGCRSPEVEYLVPHIGVENNYLEPQDFAEHLRRCGLEVGDVRTLPPDPFRASSACAIKIGDSEIAVYKYDVSSAVQKKRLQAIADAHRVYVIGLPYAASVHGSFVVIGLDKNRYKYEIVKALRSFD